MSVYTPVDVSSSLSAMVVSLTAGDEAVMAFQRGPNASAPSVKPTGTMWIRTDTAAFGGSPGDGLYQWDGAAWVLRADLRGATKFLNDLGTVALAADLPAGGFKITGLADPSGPQDAATKAYVTSVAGNALIKDGSVAMTGNLDFNGHKGTSVATPTAGGDAVNKTYSDLNTPECGTSTFAAAPGRLITLGFVPARVEVFFSGGSAIYDATINTVENGSIGGSGVNVKRLNGAAASPDNVNGFRVTCAVGIVAQTFKWRAWKQ